jgi:hypothetical protein
MTELETGTLCHPFFNIYIDEAVKEWQERTDNNVIMKWMKLHCPLFMYQVLIADSKNNFKKQAFRGTQRMRSKTVIGSKIIEQIKNFMYLWYTSYTENKDIDNDIIKFQKMNGTIRGT